MQEREVDLDLRVGTTDGGRDGLHRIVDATVLGSSDSVARHRHGLLTGLSVVVVADGAAASAQVSAVLDWAPPEFRLEFVLGDPPSGLTDRLDALAWSWTAVAVPDDRAGALDAATAQSSGEFVVMASGIAGADADDLAGTFDQLGEALGLMWVNGADALVLGPTDGAPPFSDVTAVGPGPDQRPGRLAVATGLQRGDGRHLVIMRRWVARFLFDGLGRAIDPVQEFGDRVRLLELRLLEVLGEP